MSHIPKGSQCEYVGLLSSRPFPVCIIGEIVIQLNSCKMEYYSTIILLIDMEKFHGVLSGEEKAIYEQDIPKVPFFKKQNVYCVNYTLV